MKILSKTSVIILVAMMAIQACQKNSNDSDVFVSGSENQWPMSGGPNGNWKITTDKEVPLKWSVRTGENIKWKKALPEGGQSGIAVWDDKLFLTINPPNENPKYDEVLVSFSKAKQTFENLFAKELKNLEDRRDKKLLKIKKELKQPAKKWEELLASNKNYQHASELEKPNAAAGLKRKTKIGKAYVKIFKKYQNYVIEQSKELKETYKQFLIQEKLKKGGLVPKISYCYV